MTVPGDNSVDLFTNDLGVIVVMDASGAGRRGSSAPADSGLKAPSDPSACSALRGLPSQPAKLQGCVCGFVVRGAPHASCICRPGSRMWPGVGVAGKEVAGYNLVVGGGLGRTHRDDETFPRLADPLGCGARRVPAWGRQSAAHVLLACVLTCCGKADTGLAARWPRPAVCRYVHKDDLFHAVKAVLATQRDYGRRDNRKQARLKYLVHEWGIDRFRCAPRVCHGDGREPARQQEPLLRGRRPWCWRLQRALRWADVSGPCVAAVAGPPGR